MQTDAPAVHRRPSLPVIAALLFVLSAGLVAGLVHQSLSDGSAPQAQAAAAEWGD
jgi:hypothetical protein